jgi:hypothetical protein
MSDYFESALLCHIYILENDLGTLAPELTFENCIKLGFVLE